MRSVNPMNINTILFFCFALLLSLCTRYMLLLYMYQPTCLLANISKTASRSSSSANIRINSSRASPIRSLSLLSTTKINPWSDNLKKKYSMYLIVQVKVNFKTSENYVLVYFGNSASTMDESCLDRLRPTQ